LESLGFALFQFEGGEQVDEAVALDHDVAAHGRCRLCVLVRQDGRHDRLVLAQRGLDAAAAAQLDAAIGGQAVAQVERLLLQEAVVAALVLVSDSGRADRAPNQDGDVVGAAIVQGILQQRLAGLARTGQVAESLGDPLVRDVLGQAVAAEQHDGPPVPHDARDHRCRFLPSDGVETKPDAPPPPPPPSFSFVVFGDNQFATNSCTSGIPERMAVPKAILKLSPDLVLHTGDLMDHGYDSGAYAKFVSCYSGMLAKLPFFPTMGNHDAGYLGVKNYKRYLARQLFTPVGIQTGEGFIHVDTRDTGKGRWYRATKNQPFIAIPRNYWLKCQ